MFQVFGRGPHLENEVTRGIEDARDDKFGLARLFCGITFYGHVFAPWLEVP